MGEGSESALLRDQESLVPRRVLDGNKRIAATLFLYFLDRNGALFIGETKRIGDSTLVAATILIAESQPEEKSAMVALVMNFLELGAAR